MEPGMKFFGVSPHPTGDHEFSELYEVPLIAAVALEWISLFHMFMRATPRPRSDGSPKETTGGCMRRSLWGRSGDGLPPRYRQSPAVAQVAHADHIVVLDPTGARYFGFDQVGARIWHLLESGVTAGDIVDRIVSEYDAPREQVRADVNEFLGQLANARLITAERQA